MKNVITVTVYGVANSGRTTVAEIIHSALERAGIDVERPEGSEPFNDKTRLRRVQTVSKKTRVIIAEEQLQRRPR